MIIPPVTASNPYLDFARANNLNYGDVLNYVGILDNQFDEKSYWHWKALELAEDIRFIIQEFRLSLKKHYGI
jgi:predicted component of type VI protein secretion system